MHIVIPMAGRSTRYFEAGYALPKAMLPAGRRSVMGHIVEMFNPENDSFTYIINKEDETQYAISAFLKQLPVKKARIITIAPHGKGPVFTLLQAEEALSADAEVIVNYCDCAADWSYKDFLRTVREGDYDGALPSFRGFHPASQSPVLFAYMKTDAQNELMEIREKQSFTSDRRAEHASTGTYYFKKWEYVIRYGRELMDRGLAISGEYYTSLLFNPMRRDGLRSRVYEVERFINFGTPEDYEDYLVWARALTQ